MISIYYYEVILCSRVETLSYLQRIVARLFKIIPEEKYRYEIRCNISSNSKIDRNDIICTQDKAIWFVINIIGRGTIIIRNTTLLPKDYKIYGKIYKVSSTYK